jgi:heptosyltransferase-2
MKKNNLVSPDDYSIATSASKEAMERNNGSFTVKMLVIRLSSIGDIVLTTPVLRCLKTQFSCISLHFLIKRQFVSVIEHNPYIDKIHFWEDDFGAMLRKLKDEKFNLIIDLHKNIRSKRIKFLLGTLAVSFPKLNFKKWLAVRFKIHCLPDIHIVDRYFEAVKIIKVFNDEQGLDYFISENEQIGKEHLPEGFFENYDVLVIGGAHVTKQIPIEKAIEICRLLERPVVICGGESDKEKGDAIAILAGTHVFNASGLFSLNQSASLIQHAQQVITSDTGMMHIAAAFKKRIISLWGNTVPEFGMYPYMPKHQERSIILEVKTLKCRPCSKIGYKKCPLGHFRCMKDIVFDKMTFISEK